MKKIIFIVCLLQICSFVHSQESVVPLNTNEYCPNTNITFTVTVPGENAVVTSYTNAPILVSGANIISTLPSNTVFTFVGRFIDINVKQV